MGPRRRSLKRKLAGRRLGCRLASSDADVESGDFLHGSAHKLAPSVAGQIEKIGIARHDVTVR
jgi:hypothetical protein